MDDQTPDVRDELDSDRERSLYRMPDATELEEVRKKSYRERQLEHLAEVRKPLTSGEPDDEGAGESKPKDPSEWPALGAYIKPRPKTDAADEADD